MTRKTVSLIIISLLVALTATAQNSTSSPYSYFGIGILVPREHAAMAGVGHSGIAVATNEWLNTSNPAALNSLDSLTFYFNFQLKALSAHQENYNYSCRSNSGNIDGITMGFRLTKWWGAALGYTPYSSIGYSMNEEKNIVGTEDYYTINHTGSGGLSNAFITNSLTLFKHISFGVSAGVMWGKIIKKETAEFENVIGGEDVYNEKKYTMNNLFFEYGVQFDFNLGKKNNFRFGAVYNEKTKMRSSYDHNVSNNVSSSLFFDDVTPLDGEFTVPRSYGAGFAYRRSHLFLLTADYRVNEWGELKNMVFGEKAKFEDNYQVGGGIEYSPGLPGDPFYKRMRYRLGYNYTSSYLKFKKNQLDRIDIIDGVAIPVYKYHDIDTHAITAGLTIPLGRSRNAVTVGYEFQFRGNTLMDGLVEERTSIFKFSLDIQETWFMKSKFD